MRVKKRQIRSGPMVESQNLSLELKLTYLKLHPVMLESLVNLVTPILECAQFKFLECVLYCYVEVRRVLG